jgi:hypothetical protein
MVEENIGEQSDEFVEGVGDESRDQPDSCSEERHKHHAELGRLGRPDIRDLRACGADGGRRRTGSGNFRHV